MTPEEVVEVFEREFDATEYVTYEAVMAWLQGRVDACGRDPKARKFVMRYWPENMGKPSDGIEIDRVDELARLLDRIEAECQLGFGETDPRRPTRGRRGDRRELLSILPPHATADEHASVEPAQIEGETNGNA